MNELMTYYFKMHENSGETTTIKLEVTNEFNIENFCREFNAEQIFRSEYDFLRKKVGA